MFLRPQQASNTPLMAEIASRNLENPVSDFPFQDCLQINQNCSANLSPFYNPGLNPIYSQSQGGLTCNFPASRKRGREEDSDLNPFINSRISTGLQLSVEKLNQNRQLCSSCSSFDQDISVKIQRQQQELDQFVVLQTEKIRAEVELKRRDYWRNVLAAVEQGMQKILRGKDEEIAKMSRRNSVLEERARVLLMEAQIWKTLAQSNEATVTALRRDLQVAQAREEEGQGDNGEAEDSGSCCDGDVNCRKVDRSCRGCRKNELSILVLPCRHLCLCTDCESSFESCPLCLCAKSASVQVYMS